MHPMGEPRAHFLLTIGMAKACGIDLGQALRDGVLTPAEYAETIERCRHCADPVACQTWLRQTEAASEPPAYCKNAALIAELRAL